MKQWLVVVHKGDNYTWLQVLATAATADEARERVAGALGDPWRVESVSLLAQTND